jgi:hypothetical protein
LVLSCHGGTHRTGPVWEVVENRLQEQPAEGDRSSVSERRDSDRCSLQIGPYCSHDQIGALNVLSVFGPLVIELMGTNGENGARVASVSQDHALGVEIGTTRFDVPPEARTQKALNIGFIPGPF